MPIQTPGGFTTRLASDPSVPEKTARKAIGMLDRIHETGMMVGNSPLILASGIIYIAAQDDGLKVSQTKIVRASGTTTVGMRKAMKRIRSVLDDHHK